MKQEKIEIGIAMCLLGARVRYDGDHKLDRFMKQTLGCFFRWIPVCPEVECGLPVPREAMQLVGDPAAPRLVTRETKIDHTDRILEWTEKKTAELEKSGLSGFIFKSRSPSCALRGMEVFGPSGKPARRGTGIFAREIMRRFPRLPVEDDIGLHDPAARENFLEKVFVYRRWRDYVEHDGSLHGLARFHARHELLVMAHSPEHMRRLRATAAEAEGRSRSGLQQRYASTLMEALDLRTTVRKNTDVLRHVMSRLKKELSADEKRELIEAIENYRTGAVPLVVPVTLLRHCARKYGVAGLEDQYYLDPQPLELMSRCHA